MESEYAVVDLLKREKLKLVVAESCTAGALAARIVNVPGASDVLNGGFITYTDRAKHKMLGVSEMTLETCGAVSQRCAAEMAEGAVKEGEGDVGISVTGLAGPGGGTRETPVGTVFIGCRARGNTVVKEFHFPGSRSEVRSAAVEKALLLLLECCRRASGETAGKGQETGH